MKLKKLLVSFITLSIFITGCSTINRKEVVSDKAKQQQTMTKVQNDVNEIMSKDYEYVLKNMGTPYSTTYWIEKDQINNTKTIDELNHTVNVGLVYPKYTADNELEGSALYIELDKNKVIEVQTYEFSSYNEEELEDDNVALIIDKYSDDAKLDLQDIESMKLDTYKGKSTDDIYNKLNCIDPNLAAYDMVSKSKSIEVYMLRDSESNKKNSNSVLTVFINNNKINDIKIINSSVLLDIAKDYLLN
ncbi:hypothetical protein EAI30_04805 [Romboutsia ilealis]|uniref:Lipoprotein n=1 Tax=Romboutsia faecis TaxID=2764597 RepID=A0ABR7JLN2_9FIRM|nr:hypothetical protein [Romboutsia faecis]MBC5995735.1 hypothetical protein [Romboutsia faecis]MRN23936.1 hypothetical protein [Romboutsia ilealis]